jgi:ketosteroid isomerase-like protein
VRAGKIDEGKSMPRAKLMHGSAEETEAAFYDALSRADLDALMALWAEDEEIVCIHPGAPRIIGHTAIRASWETIFERGGIDIEPGRVRIAQNMLTSVHNLVEEIRHPESDRPNMHVLATNIYLKTAQGWRMVMHHASIAQGTAGNDPKASSTLH